MNDSVVIRIDGQYAKRILAVEAAMKKKNKNWDQRLRWFEDLPEDAKCQY